MENNNGFRAIAKGLPMSAHKIRPIANNIRRRPYSEVIAVLETLPNKGAKFLRKVIQSAAANAMYHNKNLDEDMLYVKELLVDEGSSQKRIWPRSRGRADRLIKRSAHITVVVDEIGSTEA